MANLSLLRHQMKKNDINAYIVTKFDPHQTEYADSYYNATSFISNFTGSNATILVTETEAFLWTDSRYFLQAEKELTNEFKLQKMGYQSTPDILTVAAKYKNVGIDFATFPAENGKKLEERLKEAQGNLIHIDLISPIWKGRQFERREGIFLYDETFTGESSVSKLSRVREEMKTPCYVVSSLDDIAWVLNIRSLGEFNTFNFLAYLVIEKNKEILFINKEAGDTLPTHIEVRGYDEIFEYIKNKEVSIAPTRTNFKIYKSITAKEVLSHDIITDLKSRKNETEVENIKKANVKDAVVHVKFYKWLKSNGVGHTEYEIGQKLYNMRMEAGAKNHSFPPIIGFLENGAIVHYRASENSKTIENKGFLLVDSGANYEEGTTDITRTIAMGSLSEQEKIDYTLVLKSNISLNIQKFPSGTSGAGIDALTRKPLWDRGLDFGHGTGHGIGHFLNVHEGPVSISPKSTLPLEEGNLLSNEPGLYINGKYGIRLENTVLVKKCDAFIKNSNFLEFEAVSFIPFEKEAIVKELLTYEELSFLNEYHQKTYDILEPFLTEDEREWLKERTSKI